MVIRRCPTCNDRTQWTDKEGKDYYGRDQQQRFEEYITQGIEQKDIRGEYSYCRKCKQWIKANITHWTRHTGEI